MAVVVPNRSLLRQRIMPSPFLNWRAVNCLNTMKIKSLVQWLVTGRKATAKQMVQLGLALMAVLFSSLGHGTGLNWPSNQLLPAFSQPVPLLDMIDLTHATGDEKNLFASLAGIVNRTQPQIILGGEHNTWQNLHNLTYTVVSSNYAMITKYRSSITGLVVTDSNQPDTINLATTIAGVKNELICAPSLMPILTAAPYNLPIVDDLRGRFPDKYAVYNYLYSTYWSQCTHRVLAGLSPTIAASLREYLVSLQVATVWLNPSVPQDATTLAQFASGMTPNNSLYVGWWPNEGSGLNWIAHYGIPVMASDFYSFGSVFSGYRPTVTFPTVPPPPPLENKIYVAFIISDGDNIQYMQGLMKARWGSAARGQVPISWTVSPLCVDIDPGMLNYYWRTASANECLISGPDGAGYAHITHWNAANLDGFTKLSNSYLQRSGLRVVTVWNAVKTNIAQSYAANCPSLIGLTDQAGKYNAVDNGLRTIALDPTYPSRIPQMIAALTRAAANWNGTSPMFIAAQADTWGLSPHDLLTIMKSLDSNKYRFIRADHLFMLANGQVTPATINVRTANQVGTANKYPFNPNWTVAPGSLIKGQVPSTATGDFSEEVADRSVNSLTASGSLAIDRIKGASSLTASTNYVTCGNGTGAGSSLVYALNGSTSGYSLSNIMVYGGWTDNGRDQQAYTVSYSTTADPTTFIPLTSVNYNPSVVPNTPSATKVTITPAAANGVLAANVAAVKFDFSNPAAKNGYGGYGQIGIYGTASPIITPTNELGTANTYPFAPSWSVPKSGDIILGRAPGIVQGDFSLEVFGRNVDSLTSGGSLAIDRIRGTSSPTTSTNYVTCGNSGGPGWNIVYPLNGSANGYNLSNITVYGGWATHGRDQQAYTVSYSMVTAPTTFIPLTSVNYNPLVPDNIPSATRVAITPAAGAHGILAANVAAVKFDFSGSPVEKGYCGYSQIAIYGTANSTVLGAPTGVMPTSGNGQISLSWAASSGATGYNVKRSPVSGGIYTTIAKVTGTSYLDADLANGTTYYYVISAVNAGAESYDSSEVSAQLRFSIDPSPAQMDYRASYPALLFQPSSAQRAPD